MARTAPRRRLALLAWLLLSATIASGVVSSGCGALAKDELEARLLALEGNQPVRARGLEHRRVVLELEGEPREVELTLLRAGPPAASAAPPLVFVHGTPGSLFTWTELILGGPGFEGLAATREVWALDVLGHGTTRTAAPPYTFQRCADFVAGAIRALELPPVVLVGHSYGGEFCWRAALDHPELISRLVLIDSSGYARPADGWLPEEEAMRENPLARIGYLLNSRERIAGAYQPHFRDPLPAERVEELYLVCENRDNWRCMVELARDENGARQAELAELRVPTLLVWGAEDIAYPADLYARRFERDLPDARLELVPGCGHYPQEERPAELARILRGFLDESPAGISPDPADPKPGTAMLNFLLAAPLVAATPSDPAIGTSPAWSELRAAGFEPARILPPAPGARDELEPGPLARRLEALIARRYEAGPGPVGPRCFGDAAAALRARRGTPQAQRALLDELQLTRRELWTEQGEELRQLGLDGELTGSDWDPADDLEADGILMGGEWSRAGRGAGPWREVEGSEKVFEAATLIYADLEAIKEAENDYRRYPQRPGTAYEEIHAEAGSLLRGRDELGREFARLAIFFECDLPFPFGGYECELEILNRLDAQGRLVCDIYTDSDDFLWMAGRDLFLPVYDSEGSWVATLLVRSFGFDLAGVPDGDSNRREALRASLGNLKREAEWLYYRRGAEPRTVTGAIPMFPVRGVRAR